MADRWQNRSKEYVYIFIQDISDGRNIYKVGRTTNMKQRAQDHSTMAPKGCMAFEQLCDNSRLVEKLVLEKLKAMQIELRNEVVYDFPFNDLKRLIKEVAEFLQPLGPRQPTPVIQNGGLAQISEDKQSQDPDYFSTFQRRLASGKVPQDERRSPDQHVKFYERGQTYLTTTRHLYDLYRTFAKDQGGDESDLIPRNAFTQNMRDIFPIQFDQKQTNRRNGTRIKITISEPNGR